MLKAEQIIANVMKIRLVAVRWNMTAKCWAKDTHWNYSVD
jgi:hypothetical protein